MRELHLASPSAHPPFPCNQVRFMTAQLVLALAHMHARSIVYRDLKPANVLIDDAGHLRMVSTYLLFPPASTTSIPGNGEQPGADLIQSRFPWDRILR